MRGCGRRGLYILQVVSGGGGLEGEDAGVGDVLDAVEEHNDEDAGDGFGGDDALKLGVGRLAGVHQHADHHRR